MSIRLATVFFLAALTLAANLRAETAYVVDEFEITMRSGKSTSHQITAMLGSGERLEVLERDPDAGYARVRTANGREGWVLLRFLSPEPAARAQLAEARRQLEALQAGTLTEELDAANETIAALQTQTSALERTVAELSDELEQTRQAAAEPMKLAQQNSQYRQQLQEQRELEQGLREENRRLRAAEQRRWFVAGAIVLSGGILLGLILPKLRFSRRKRWNEL